MKIVLPERVTLEQRLIGNEGIKEGDDRRKGHFGKGAIHFDWSQTLKWKLLPIPGTAGCPCGFGKGSGGK